MFIDKSKATTENIYFPKNKNNEYTSTTNGTHQYILTCDLNQHSNL